MNHTLRGINQCIISLTNHPDPVIRWNVNHRILSRSKSNMDNHEELTGFYSSPIITKLLSDRNADGQIPIHPYNKWFGSHWVLSILADLGFPPGDQSLKPLLEQCYQVWLSKEHLQHIKIINDRTRRCASQEGNCIYYSLALGLADDRTEELTARLLKWQWDDGGWNCDKRPEATKSSFHESLIPLRALALYARHSGDGNVKRAADRAADVFLKRSLFKKVIDGSVIDKNFLKLHYPPYWHYDILFGLKVLAEAGYIKDPRCSDALDILMSKQLADGGFPAEDRYYRVDDKKLSGHSRVDWGGTSKQHMNPFVTIDSLLVLKQADRLVV